MSAAAEIQRARVRLLIAALTSCEPRFVLDDSRPPVPVDLADRLARRGLHG
jgi:hypothetical protein